LLLVLVSLHQHHVARWWTNDAHQYSLVIVLARHYAHRRRSVHLVIAVIIARIVIIAPTILPRLSIIIVIIVARIVIIALVPSS
jgi:hypothetical protein